MKTFEKDMELDKLLKGVKLDSPGPDFTVSVMNRVFEEKALQEKVEKSRVLGRSFWIIMALFIVLIAAVAIASLTGAQPESDLARLLPNVNSGGIAQQYESFFQKINAVPLSIAGILLASSLLLFLDRFLNAKSKFHI